MQRLIMLLVDECRLLWGNACGSVGGPTAQRIRLPIKNIRARQTYLGALKLWSGTTGLWEADGGNQDTTVAFLHDVRRVFEGRQLVIVWDGAPYPRAGRVRDDLRQLNGETCPESQRQIHLIRCAPYAPAQNPMEDVWLAGKRAVRQQWADLSTFEDVKAVFSLTMTCQRVLFNTLNWDGRADLIRIREELERGGKFPAYSYN
jgi:transposase